MTSFLLCVMEKKQVYGLLVIWLVMNLVQARFTNIQEDETYYYLYSLHLSWGYFDHPPFVAWIIRIGSWFFHDILKVRFVTVVLQPLTLGLIWHQLRFKSPVSQQQIIFFFLSAFVMVMFSVYGFITTPDAPLLFFTALFFFAYQQFLQKTDTATILIMIVSVTGLLYSKYQGILVVFFTVASNKALFKKPAFYIIALSSLILFLPHVYWQFSHRFPSLQFHAVDRAEPFKWAYFLEYVPNQMLAFNPFIWIAAAYILVKYRYQDYYQRALYYNIAGIFIVFWISTFRGHAEPHWTIVTAVPMLIAINEHLHEHTAFFKNIRKLLAFSAVLILMLRVALIAGWVPEQLGFSAKPAYYQSIARAAAHRPVIFANNHIEPALYTYFTGDTAISFPTLQNRKSQFDIWNFQYNWLGKPAFCVGNYQGKASTYYANGSIWYGFGTDSLYITQALHFNYTLPHTPIHQGDTLRIPFLLQNNGLQPYCLQSSDFSTVSGIVLVKAQQYILLPNNNPLPQQCIAPQASMQDTMYIAIPALAKGNYQLTLYTGNCLGNTPNSKTMPVVIE
ncbi:MAG: hypothetical protein GTN67_13710 [Hydrotalea flava]|uniref:glycosyltransferase family 39 protein n=2 Tax=Hydrotalea TaxID=1004300 RepID=UPI00102813B0|nr:MULTISPECIES: glycosyltransferase family 39 protein [unclassified Hydrotalea]NIM36355.1 hypothetical protein [Hydrotalea flava]NIM39210.1 hypothetical protein [Hydrotalea flava]NIN04449.1 hypothetical protein [Hydrotalea flava]NIN16069.1 hypothetical protein [Hydrotalea flava]NIO95136.1 hypothetical protein [Hydrotalea flava]